MADVTRPQSNPGDILNWPMLKIVYRTDADKIAALLPPGITAGAEPNVRITVYNFPVGGEPEYGVVVNVDADYAGMPGEYTLGMGINQENAIYSSQERWGQPKYFATTTFFRLMDYVQAKAEHQGFTWLEFHGEVTGPVEPGPEFEQNEWWIKCARAVDMAPEHYDFPPHVVRVHSRYGTAFMEEVKGEVILRESPWDPVASLLPLREQVSARLWTPIFLDRKITLEGELDGSAYWPFADTIGGSRWPGKDGGPRR